MKASDTQSGGQVRIVIGPWDEKSTYTSFFAAMSPAERLGPVIATITSAQRGTYVMVDVTAALQRDGSVELVIIPTAQGTSVKYASRETRDARAPQLIVER